jgi:hypothetical protein
MDRTASIEALRKAFREQRLTLFLGAGVSVANGLPTWEKLVLSLYFSTISEQKMNGWRPYANYLYAISEWYLKRSIEPLEITARKTKSFYEDSNAGRKAFLDAIRDALYGVNTFLNPADLRQGNSTLDAVARLCAAERNGRFGVSSVISYNYDNLLELALTKERPRQAIYSNDAQITDRLPIFHVHGYVPYQIDEIENSNAGIIFTEAEYNIVASDPYSWSNIVQLREMSSNVGLMIGLSLSDRNIRRLLDALSRSPLKPKIFAVLKKPTLTEVSDDDADGIHERAIEIRGKFDRSGIKSSNPMGEGAGFRRRKRSLHGIWTGVKSARRSELPAGRKGEKQYQYEIRGIVEEVERLAQEQQHRVMKQLGISPIWIADYDDIPDVLLEISKRH